jgi:elongator complex protein 3
MEKVVFVKYFWYVNGMIFDSIKTELDVEKLKKRIVKDAGLFARVVEIRKNLTYSRRTRMNTNPSSYAMPTNAEILALYRELVAEGSEVFNQETELLLRKIKTKSNSGVAVISLLTKPFPCPGRCTYCPTEENMPKSYLSKEPAAARALSNDFDPRKQIFSRLQSLLVNGHPVEKVEMIIIGGTWSFYHPAYQEYVISECFRACNDFSVDGVHKDSSKKPLVELQEENEKAECRIIGLSIETRPDYITPVEVERLRLFGVTKVEIGVQHLDDAILKLTKRDMKAAGIAKGTERLRDAGFKIVYHMMPNLPGSDTEKDIAMFPKLFEEGCGYHPDMLKIYPCMVLEHSELYETWKAGGFRPYTDEELMHVLREAKKVIPPYVRILRVIRDIPASYIQAGSKISNMRQWLIEDQKKFGWRCKCIRCREVREREVNFPDFELRRLEYRTLSGTEIFLSFEKKMGDVLASFTRLRLPDKDKEPILPVLKDAALIRELHTYGRLAKLGQEGSQSQHVGFGRLLMAEAEKIARDAGYKKLAVISGIGVREYYRKLGYTLEGTYMVKSL